MTVTMTMTMQEKQGTMPLLKIQTHSAPQNDHLNFSFPKDIHVDGGNLARNSCKTALCQSTFFLDTLYVP